MDFSKRFLTQIQLKEVVSFLWQNEDLQNEIKAPPSLSQVGTNPPRETRRNFNVAVELDSRNFSSYMVRIRITSVSIVLIERKHQHADVLKVPLRGIWGQRFGCRQYSVHILQSGFKSEVLHLSNTEKE
jgi:hypothetical protein